MLSLPLVCGTQGAEIAQNMFIFIVLNGDWVQMVAYELPYWVLLAVSWSGGLIGLDGL